MDVAAENRESMTMLLLDAFSKLYGAFGSVKVFVTSQTPDARVSQAFSSIVALPY